MNKQSGFTLLELVIALAIFALLGLASGRLFDTVVRAQQATTSHEQDLRRLQRAVGVIERDVLQLASAVIVLGPTTLQLQRGNWRNPQDLPRSERQQVIYRLDNQMLWRESRGLESSTVERQRLLDDVRMLNWRLFDRDVGWSHVWPVGKGAAATPPQALEMVLSAGRFEQVRRVLPLPQGHP
ncbi:type II secretion system protein GspJ [Pseudomonas fluorescens]|jgi:general secretion pathway protein J|uniref:Type II secretion system protein J n=2 Tax=Pseudomonas TaxID=286 RepID=A0A1B3D2T3_PSEFL|nr:MULTISPECIES: type II secretion system protein GspJ [Pseudomonas]AHC33062.1 N-terminal cleavage protein [Pseudomonas sp. TKP]AOE65674.1 type II secretion system protein GspJ [Pseudomonas fluorescens]AOE71611.1 type II secretion system protein GspJ [Pseudomonas fluorescens]MBL1308711.1 prepilin-type N-terminal cleavage/methylation domain-containing protein [Pseudomonas sp.]MDR6575286.1 general secretion pathway protein J [Pseudomonas extremaustralis]